MSVRCKACGRFGKEDEMVVCVKCRDPQHAVCAKANEGDDAWNCENCGKDMHDSKSSSSKSSVRTKKSENLKEKLLHAEISLLKLQLSRSIREEEAEQREALEKQLQGARQAERNKSICSGSSMSGREKVEEWMKERLPEEENGGENPRGGAKPMPAKDYANVCTQDKVKLAQPMEDKKQNGDKHPTRQQLTARQVMGKDLPIFNGDPNDWALWYANFVRTTDACGFTEDENLLRLQRCLKGQALEMVSGRLLLPQNVPGIIELLKMRYGRSDILVRALVEKITASPSPTTNDLNSIISYACVVDNLVQHLESTNMHKHLSNPMLLHEMVQKLPAGYKLKWAEYKMANKEEGDIGTFGKFLNSIMMMAFEVTDESRKEKPKVNKGRVHVHRETTAVQRWRKPCGICNGGGHGPSTCATFKGMTLEERLKKTESLKLCRICLNGHGDSPCRSSRECEVENCRLRHNTLLHSPTPPSSSTAGYCASHQKGGGSSGAQFRVIPVTLQNGERKVDIYALVDEGSELTLLDQEVADQLNVNGVAEELSMVWTGNISRVEKKSKKIDKHLHRKHSHLIRLRFIYPQIKRT